MKTLKSYDFPAFGTRTASNYDWAKLLDGSIYQLEQGEGKDFQCKQQTMIMMARNRAKKLGLKLKGTKVEGGVVIQAVPGDGPVLGDPAPETEAAPKGKAKKKK